MLEIKEYVWHLSQGPFRPVPKGTGRLTMEGALRDWPGNLRP